MDLGKIGKYIAKKRQENNYTQESLAEKLGVSNRSVSKWERGVCLPDANNIGKLCKLFNISYNELFSGEDLKKADYEKKAEEILKEFSRIETAHNKKLLLYEYILGFITTVFFLALILAVSYAEMPTIAKIALSILGFILFITSISFCIKIETEAGKYKCEHCGYLYIPKYSSVYFAPHLGRTRYMVCPKCHKKSWQKKVA